ncbi:MAG: hypothetical protein QM564_03975 [Bergeyella sp.]
MNYSELIRRFWEHNEKQPLGAVAVSLYFFLLEIWAKNDEHDFKLSDTEICERLKITRPTIIALRQKLSNLGMIQYQSQNGLPGQYKILREYPPVLSVFENPKKTIPKKKKTAGKPLQKSKIFLNENSSVDNLPKISPPTLIPISSNIPPLEEFMHYAKALENYVPELENLIEEKYKNWLGNQWKNGYNKPITNWKSSIKNAIPFLQSELESENSAPENKIALQTIKRPRSIFDG